MFLNTVKLVPEIVGCKPGWYSSIKLSYDKAAIIRAANENVFSCQNPKGAGSQERLSYLISVY
jgi:hypothetical protein